jgi:hypothetical protein
MAMDRNAVRSNVRIQCGDYGICTANSDCFKNIPVLEECAIKEIIAAHKTMESFLQMKISFIYVWFKNYNY